MKQVKAQARKLCAVNFGLLLMVTISCILFPLLLRTGRTFLNLWFVILVELAVGVLLEPILSMGRYRCELMLLKGEKVKYRELYFFTKKPKHLGASVMVMLFSGRGAAEAVLVCNLLRQPAAFNAGAATNVLRYCLLLLSAAFGILSIALSLVFFLAPFELAENPDKKILDVLKNSAKKMHGQKWRLICLYFSFIGWQVLAAVLVPISGAFGAVAVIVVLICLSVLLSLYIYTSVAVFARQILYDISPEELDAPEDEIVNSFMRISDEMNHYDGMRYNPALEVLGGTSPADLMPIPQELTDVEEVAAEYDGEEDTGAAEHNSYEDAEWAAYHGCEELKMTEEERELADMFEDKQTLPSGDFTVADTARVLKDYQPLELLIKSEVYSFIKEEKRIKEMFQTVYRCALKDLRGYEAGSGHKGVAAEIVTLRKNNFRLLLKIQEVASPLESRISGIFYINE